MASPTTPNQLGNDVLVVCLPRPSKPDQVWMVALEAKYPGLKVRWAGPTKGLDSVDGVPPEIWEGATLLLSLAAPPVELIPNVRFVQAPSAGADRWIKHPKYKEPHVQICTANGIHAPQIAEWVMGAWLMAQHHFLEYAGYMKSGIGWSRQTAPMGDDSVGMRIGILGYGAIGRQCARLARGLGMEVYAFTRSEKATAAARHDDSFCVPGTGDPQGELAARWFHGTGAAAINDFLGQSLDLLVVATPLTATTTGLLSREQFSVLASAAAGAGRRPTYVVNIARGKVIDTDALITALETGQISGAALDVTDPEPLPVDHALWAAPNVFVSPHVSWQSSHLWQRTAAVLEANLERLNAGEPLINAINREVHY